MKKLLFLLPVFISTVCDSAPSSFLSTLLLRRPHKHRALFTPDKEPLQSNHPPPLNEGLVHTGGGGKSGELSQDPMIRFFQTSHRVTADSVPSKLLRPPEFSSVAGRGGVSGEGKEWDRSASTARVTLHPLNAEPASAETRKVVHFNYAATEEEEQDYGYFSLSPPSPRKDDRGNGGGSDLNKKTH
eukprot:Protomagalhaensia_wolfi_Nauph_80__6147@NODE_898_length_1900_cov_150_243418_g676_i0_p1_GENE_NODE_898_length_1900_cov_150_243418_g676_i0NODE_898_length_1900_cov_150_243418_g676_i0_p1_ORF_typecomplete_len186_score31_13_NODE_898_length_1900_cov_150_243418_g676_i0225782